MAAVLKQRCGLELGTRSPPGCFPPLYRVDTPFDHAAALWPGFHEGQPLGSKSVTRRRADHDPVRHDGERARESLLRRISSSNSDDSRALSDMLLSFTRKVGPATLAEEVARTAAYLHSLAGARDCFISVHTFYGWRNNQHLKHLTCLMIDLDLSLAKERGRDFGEDFMAMRQCALDKISMAGIPMPNLAVHTGNGVHLYWLFERPVTSQAEPRWKVCLKRLIELLRPFGADRSVRDPARVLRLVGTINTKAPAHCRSVTAQVLVPPRYPFDFLADQILPLTRRELESARKRKINGEVKGGVNDEVKAQLVELAPRRARRDAKRQLQGEQLRGDASGSSPSAAGKRGRPGRSFSATATARLSDLTLLASTLYPHGIAEGHRDRYLFAATCCLVWMCREETLEAEVLAWKDAHICDMSDREALDTMGSALRRAQQASEAKAAGVRLGLYKDPRYLHAAEALWYDFGEEVESAGLVDRMQTILPAGVRAERRLAAKRAKSPDHYTGAGIRQSNVPKALRARELRDRNQTLCEIASALGTTATTIKAWLALSVEALSRATAFPAASIAASSPPTKLPTDPQPISFMQPAAPRAHCASDAQHSLFESTEDTGITADTPNPQPSYPQGAPSVAPAPVSSKCSLTNGVAMQISGFASLMRVAQGGSGGISASVSATAAPGAGAGAARGGDEPVDRQETPDPQAEAKRTRKPPKLSAVEGPQSASAGKEFMPSPTPSHRRGVLDGAGPAINPPQPRKTMPNSTPPPLTRPVPAPTTPALPIPSPASQVAPTPKISGFGKPRETFDEQLLHDMRRWPLQHGLRALGLHFKADASYQPRTGGERIHVSLESGQVIELVQTGVRWFDTKADKGGGGVIDLTMHLLDCNFVTAVRRLTGA